MPTRNTLNIPAAEVKKGDLLQHNGQVLVIAVRQGPVNTKITFADSEGGLPKNVNRKNDRILTVIREEETPEEAAARRDAVQFQHRAMIGAEAVKRMRKAEQDRAEARQAFADEIIQRGAMEGIRWGNLEKAIRAEVHADLWDEVVTFIDRTTIPVTLWEALNYVADRLRKDLLDRGVDDGSTSMVSNVMERCRFDAKREWLRDGYASPIPYAKEWAERSPRQLLAEAAEAREKRP